LHVAYLDNDCNDVNRLFVHDQGYRTTGRFETGCTGEKQVIKTFGMCAAALLAFSGVQAVQAQSWSSSPSNWQNSPSRYGNERIIRDKNGNAAGYVVPKPDGGANIFDLRGNRQGYLPPR
jgi:hypothetical protein